MARTRFWWRSPQDEDRSPSWAGFDEHVLKIADAAKLKEIIGMATAYFERRFLPGMAGEAVKDSLAPSCT